MAISSRPRLNRPTVSPPKAKADQLDVQEWEDDLYQQARAKFPAVRWWHGYRKVGDWLGSYCYVCEGFIVTFTTAYPLPAAVKERVSKHKYQHHAGKRPSLARIN